MATATAAATMPAAVAPAGRRRRGMIVATSGRKHGEFLG